MREIEMEHELLAESAHGVLTLTLNRPTRRNALSVVLYDALLVELEKAAQDASVGAVVLTGAGAAFCAGGDVARMASAPKTPISFEERVAALRRRTRISELLHSMSKPTIAMMRGPAVGAGLSLALACDMRIADTSIRLSTGFVKMGLPGDFGGHYFLPRIVGMAKARELYLMSSTIDAGEALRIGLVNKVLEPGDLLPGVQKIAEAMASGPRTALAYIKDNLNQAPSLTLAQTLDAEAMRHARCVETSDYREAVAAFAEKRQPRFKQPDGAPSRNS